MDIPKAGPEAERAVTDTGCGLGSRTGEDLEVLRTDQTAEERVSCVPLQRPVTLQGLRNRSWVWIWSGFVGPVPSGGRCGEAGPGGTLRGGTGAPARGWSEHTELRRGGR